MNGTLNHHSKTPCQLNFRDQCVHSGSTSDESLSPALVQMKVTTGAMEAKATQLTQSVCGHTQLFSPLPSWLILLWLLPNQAAQVVQLLQDDTSTCAVTRRFVVSPSTVSRAWRRNQEAALYTRRAGQGRRRASTQEQHRYPLLWARRNRRSFTKWPPAGYWCACFWPNCQKQTPLGRHEGRRPP